MKKIISVFGENFEVSDVSIDRTLAICADGTPNIHIYGPHIDAKLAVDMSKLENNEEFNSLFLTEKERRNSLDEYDVIISSCGNMTMALLLDHSQEKAYFGSSIRQKEDKNNVSIGVKLAADRALRILPPIPKDQYTKNMMEDILKFVENNACDYEVKLEFEHEKV